ncbi:hypothetical protein RB213_001889 [Colletotrichum asianum]
MSIEHPKPAQKTIMEIPGPSRHQINWRVSEGSTLDGHLLK